MLDLEPVGAPLDLVSASGCSWSRCSINSIAFMPLTTAERWQEQEPPLAGALVRYWAVHFDVPQGMGGSKSAPMGYSPVCIPSPISLSAWCCPDFGFALLGARGRDQGGTVLNKGCRPSGHRLRFPHSTYRLLHPTPFIFSRLLITCDHRRILNYSPRRSRGRCRKIG